MVSGSDHLTSYNVYAEAFTPRPETSARCTALPRQLFDERSIERWAERRGVLVKAIEDAALAMASVWHAGVGATLPHAMPLVTEAVEREFRELVARIMPFALVIDETTVDGDEARVSKTSVCGSWGPSPGRFAISPDRFGVPRASIEGTRVPLAMIRRHAHTGEARSSTMRPQAASAPLRRRMLYHGFELERDEEADCRFPARPGSQARQARDGPGTRGSQAPRRASASGAGDGGTRVLPALRRPGPRRVSASRSSRHSTKPP
ncbi:MAG: hypothetical protein U0163_15285 [Gemmatimonadaceae bacterium]